MRARCLALLVFLLGAPALAEVDLRALVREHTLANGMKWIIVERPQAPVFSANIRIRAGGMDEEPGFTGLAHLFEHMAFKGTPFIGTSDFEAEMRVLVRLEEVGDRLAELKRAGQGDTEEGKRLADELARLQQEHDALTDQNAFERLYQVNGASGLNATTNKDLTSYFVSFPSNRLELWALVEAQRFAAPVLRDFYKEIEVVREERRTRTDTSPAGALYEELIQIAFTNSPYRWPTVGYHEDLAGMTLQRARAFHDRFYVPGNAVGALVGDVKADEVIALLERTFGAIPAGPVPPAPLFTEPPLRQTRRSTVWFDAQPQLMVAFRKPRLPSRDDFVFDVMKTLLTTGRTSRLYRRLVLEERLVQGIGAFGTPGSRLDNLFVFSATPLEGKTPERVEAVLLEELERLKSEPVGERELQKVRNRIHADQARGLESNSGLASSLSYFQAIAGDWRYAADHPKVIDSITPEELQQVARRWLVPENMVVVTLQRGGGQ
jgi:predicted Zn-dependent peptidase